MMPKIPQKLRKDAIAEAICEVRFSSVESQQLPELIVGRLAGAEIWKDYKKNRLPVSDVPLPLRLQDPNLAYQPVLELKNDKGDRIAKLGHNVLSVHVYQQYPGWKEFRPQLHAAIEQLFVQVPDIQITRIGFRYVNLFRKLDHGVTSIGDLNLSISLAGSELQPPVNLNYLKSAKSEKFEHRVQVRIASPEYISGPKTKELTAAIDVDVFTSDGFSTQKQVDVMSWIDEAHDLEKKEFFLLFSEQMLKNLVEA